MKNLTPSVVNSLAMKFRVDNSIGLSEAISLKNLLRKLNILTLFCPLSEKFYGMSLRSLSGLKFILINSNSSKGRQHFSVSRSALLFRLKTYKIITVSEYSELKNLSATQTAKQYGCDTALYRSGNEGLLIGDFGEKARLLYENEIISEGHYQEIINLIFDGKD